MKRFFWIAVSLMLTACSYNPFLTPKENHTTGSAAGVAVGAGVGAGTAALFHVNKQWLVASGIAGAMVGYYMTTLRYSASGIYQAGGQVYVLGDYIGIEIPTDKIFEENSADFIPQADPVLASLSDVINRYPNHGILISGNTSGFGRLRYELKLSENRAQKVAAFLWERGISNYKQQSLETRKLLYVGYGNYFPISSDITAAGIRKNSRIQITLFPTYSKLCDDKRFKAFNNVGASTSTANFPKDYSKDFPADNLPYNPSEQRNLKGDMTDFSEDYNRVEREAMPAPGGYTPGNYKGESLNDYNTVINSDQTRSTPAVAKHGGNFKGE